MATLTIPKETVMVAITAALEGNAGSGGAGEVFRRTGEVAALLV